MTEYSTSDKTKKIDLTAEQVNKSCPAVGYQKVNVCVPVTVTPFANAGATTTKCCCEPVVTPGDVSCPGEVNGVCTFTISQTVCVEVPVSFGAMAKVGDTYVDCLEASAYDICTYCRDGEADE